MSTIRIKARQSGAAGAPSSLRSKEIAFNEMDNVLYYGKGNDGNNNATSIIPISSASGKTLTYLKANGTTLNISIS